MPFTEDADAELERLRRYEMEQRATGARLGIDYDPSGDRFTLPDTQSGARLYALVNDLVQMQKRHWWMQPVAQMALASTGIAPDSATAKAAAEIGAKIEADQGYGFQEPGGSLKAFLAAAGTAISGQGAAYGGSYDWGKVLVDPTDDTRYSTYYGKGDNGGDLTTLTANGLEQPITDHPNTAAGQQFLEKRGIVTGADAQRFRDDARATVERLTKGDVNDLSGPDKALLYQSNRNTQISDDDYRTLRSDFATPVAPVARTGFMVLDAPLQELQGQVRNVYAATHGGDPNWLQSQSDLGVAAGDLLGHREVDVGDGLFVDPNSGVRQELLKRQRERGLIGDHAVTLGRWAADTVFEPDTLAFNALSGSVDTLVAIKGDPANIALTKYAKIKEADQLFTESGGLLGMRKTVSPAAVDKFWDDPEKGGKVAAWVAGHDKTYDIWEGFNRKLPVDVAHTLARTTDPAEVADILRPLSGGVLRQKPDPFKVVSGGALGVGGLGGETPADIRLGVKRSAQQYRINNIVPMSKWDLEDATDSVVQTERFLRNVKAPDSMVYDFVDRMAGAADRNERYQILDDLMGGTKGLLVTKWGVSPEKARRLTSLFSDTQTEMRKWFVDEIGTGQNVLNRQTMIGDTLVDAPSPHLLDEFIGRFVPMPDPRELRRVTSRLRPILATKDAQQRLPLAMLNSLQDQVWKPMQLLRGAWTLRVIGEEQIRMAAAGLDSTFRHPLSALALVTGKKDVAPLIDDGRGLLERWDDAEQFRASLTHGRGKFGVDPHRVKTGDWVIVPKDPEHMTQYLDGLGSELAQLHNDTIARVVARAPSFDQAVEDVANGPGRSALVTLSKAAEDPRFLEDPEFLRGYVESVQRRISIKTGDHPDLLEAVRTGRLNGQPLSLLEQGRAELNPKAVRQLADYADHTPSAVKAQRVKYEKGDAAKQRLDRIVEGMFGTLMSRPTNYLSRSSAFKQFYYQRVPELMPLATLDAQQAALEAARAANVDKGVLKAMEAGRSTTGELTLDHIDELAKGHALDETRKLLYDVSEKSQFFDAMRLVFPFGEAWKEVLGRWAHLMSSRPQNIRRLQQVIQAARGEGLQETISGVTGDPVNGGFFHKNDRGEEVFTYPGSTLLTSKMIGVPIPLVGRTSGLNLVGQIYPALGPMMSIPVAAMIPDKPKYDGIRDALFPFGPPGSPIDAKTWLPPWVKRILQPSDNDADNTRLYTNTVDDVAKYLASTGKYDLHTQEGMSKLMEDANDKAGQFNMLRGLSSYFAPSAPTPEWLIQDKTGNVTAAAVLATEYRSLQAQERDGTIPSASQAFLDQYGTEPFLVMQSKTQSVSYGYPTDSKGLDWMRNNPDLEGKFPNVFGYFAPQSADPNDFSYNAYLRAISTGAKKPLSLEQFVKLGMARLASVQYDEARQQVQNISGGKPSDDQRAWLRSLQDALIREYPGYGESLHGGLGLNERADKEQRVREVTMAVKDPRIASTEAGQAAAEYLQAREQAQARATADGLAGFQTAKAARPIRDWLRQLGAALVREHPTFAPLWEQLFDSEMNADTDVEQAAA